MANEEGREQAIPHLQHALMDVGSGINPPSGIKFVYVCLMRFTGTMPQSSHSCRLVQFIAHCCHGLLEIKHIGPCPLCPFEPSHSGDLVQKGPCQEVSHGFEHFVAFHGQTFHLCHHTILGSVIIRIHKSSQPFPTVPNRNTHPHNSSPLCGAIIYGEILGL